MRLEVDMGNNPKKRLTAFERSAAEADRIALENKQKIIDVSKSVPTSIPIPSVHSPSTPLSDVDLSLDKTRTLRNVEIDEKYVDLSILSLQPVTFAAQHRLRQDLKVNMGDLWTPFLGINDNHVQEIAKRLIDEGKRLSIRGVNLSRVAIKSKLSFGLFCWFYRSGVDRVYIFHPHIMKPQSVRPIKGECVMIIILNAQYGISTVECLPDERISEEQVDSQYKIKI